MCLFVCAVMVVVVVAWWYGIVWWLYCVFVGKHADTNKYILSSWKKYEFKNTILFLPQFNIHPQKQPRI